jgi:adenine phosphoribosyltransferase
MRRKVMWDNNRHQGMMQENDRWGFKQYIRDIQDFPKKGVVIRDITPLLQNHKVFKEAIDKISYRFQNEKINLVVCAEARGFLIGSAVAYSLGCGIIPIRKKGKLPWWTYSETYNLEYGQDSLEMHIDAIRAGQRVLVVDDVLATGGTAKAILNMVKKYEGDIVCSVFLIELLSMNGRSKITESPVYSLIQY